MEITVVKVERIEATLRHMTEYELAGASNVGGGAAGQPAGRPLAVHRLPTRIACPHERESKCPYCPG